MKKITQFYNRLKDIEYGWYDKSNELHTHLKDFTNNYKMQDIDNIINTKHAICWELCEVERKFFKENNYKFIIVNAILKMKKRYSSHTFLIFIYNNKYYWFESSWQGQKGIKEYNSIKDIFNEIRNNYEEFSKTKNYDKNRIKFYMYKNPRKHITCKLFYIHCMLFGKKIGENYQI